MAVPHVAWTHTENLAAAFLGDPVHMDRNLGRVVCVTEKLDGSNCGIHVRRLGDDPNAPWGLAAIAGRNQHVWAPEDGSPVPLATEGATIDERVAAQKGIPVVGYGNAASLGAVPIYAAHVAVEVAKTIPGATELVLYGEAFRARTTKTVQPFASFHPFGFKVIGDRASPAAAGAADEDPAEETGVGVLATAKLTRDTHALFTRLAVRAPPVGTFGQELFDYLLTVPGHAVFPPPMVHHGPFYDGADRLHELLSTAPPTLEGFFIATDDGEPYGLYCKWKTPLFEEQANVPKLEELCASRFARATTGTTHGRPKLPPFVDALNDEKLEDGTTGMDREKAALPPNLRRVFDLACALVAASQAAKAAHKPVKLAKADAAPKAEKRKNEKLLARIDTALRREATKDPALAPGGMPEAKPARKAIADRVLASVLTELQQQMAADGEEWTDAIAREAKVETTKLVMAPIMNGDASAWRD